MTKFYWVAIRTTEQLDKASANRLTMAQTAGKNEAAWMIVPLERINSSGSIKPAIFASNAMTKGNLHLALSDQSWASTTEAEAWAKGAGSGFFEDSTDAYIVAVSDQALG
jgi:hypothetical protein